MFLPCTQWFETMIICFALICVIFIFLYTYFVYSLLLQLLTFRLMDDQNADANKSPQKDESPEEKASTAQSPSKLNLPLQMAVDEAGPSSTISPNADQGYHTQREGTDEAMETESAPFPAPTAESIFDNVSGYLAIAESCR